MTTLMEDFAQTEQQEQDSVGQIALPSQMPNRLDLTQLPPQILRSGAVEALANQNEDLMARLGVAMRRAALLENRIGELEQQQHVMQHRLSVAQDQAMVLQEKDRMQSSKTSQSENEAYEVRHQLQLLETQFTELYVTSKDRTRSLTEQIEILGRRIQRFQNYRRRMKKAVKALKTQAQNNVMRFRREEEVSRDLKVRLGEAAARIQQMSKAAESNQRQLVESYEAGLKTLRDQVQKLEGENRAYVEKTEDYQQLFDKTITFENRLIHEQRQFAEYRSMHEHEIATLQIEVSQLRSDYKSRLIESEGLQKDLAETREQRDNLIHHNTKFNDQVETLQLLWQDSQAQIEKLGTKNSALQNLNQQLSSNIQAQRHEIQQLRQELEAFNLSTGDRMKEIKGQLQLMGQAPLTPNKLTFIEQSKDESSAPQRVLSRIDTLVAEIQSGFKRQVPETTGSTESSSSTDSLGKGETATP